MTTDAGATGVPRFDVVLRGYDRRQVDEHVARMARTIARMRSDLDIIRSQPLPAVGADPLRPSPQARPGESPDMIGNFTDRMQGILQKAEEEAAEIRNRARAAARSEEERAKAQVADLTRQRDALLAEVGRLRQERDGIAGGREVAASPTSVLRPSPAGAPSGPPGAPGPLGRTRDGGQGGPGSGNDSPGGGQPAPRPRPGPGAPVPARAGQPGPGGPGPGGQPGPGGPRPGPGQSGPTGQPGRGPGQPGQSGPVGQPGHPPQRPGQGGPPPNQPAGQRPPAAQGQGQGQSMHPPGSPEPQPSDLFRPMDPARQAQAEAARAQGGQGQPEATALVNAAGQQRPPAPGVDATRRADSASHRPGQPGPNGHGQPQGPPPNGAPNGRNGQPPQNGQPPNGQPPRSPEATVLTSARPGEQQKPDDQNGRAPGRSPSGSRSG